MDGTRFTGFGGDASIPGRVRPSWEGDYDVQAIRLAHQKVIDEVNKLKNSRDMWRAISMWLIFAVMMLCLY